MSNIQKQHKISPAIAWLTIQKFIIFYCPLDGEHTRKQERRRGAFLWENMQKTNSEKTEKEPVKKVLERKNRCQQEYVLATAI